MHPQWKVRIRYVVLFVRCVCVLLRVCVWLQVDFLKNLNACLRFFEKIKGASVDTLGLRPATKAQ